MKRIWTALFKHESQAYLELKHLKSLQISGFLAEDMTFLSYENAWRTR